MKPSNGIFKIQIGQEGVESSSVTIDFSKPVFFRVFKNGEEIFDIFDIELYLANDADGPPGGSTCENPHFLISRETI